MTTGSYTQVYQTAVATAAYSVRQDEVFSAQATAANTWQEVDASSSIGSVASFVELRIRASSSCTVKVQEAGGGDTASTASGMYGSSWCYIPASGYMGIVQTPTSTTGRFDISVSSTSPTVDVDVISSFDDTDDDPVVEGLLPTGTSVARDADITFTITDDVHVDPDTIDCTLTDPDSAAIDVLINGIWQGLYTGSIDSNGLGYDVTINGGSMATGVWSAYVYAEDEHGGNHNDTWGWTVSNPAPEVVATSPTLPYVEGDAIISCEFTDDLQTDSATIDVTLTDPDENELYAVINGSVQTEYTGSVSANGTGHDVSFIVDDDMVPGAWSAYAYGEDEEGSSVDTTWYWNVPAGDVAEMQARLSVGNRGIFNCRHFPSLPEGQGSFSLDSAGIVVRNSSSEDVWQEISSISTLALSLGGHGAVAMTQIVRIAVATLGDSVIHGDLVDDAEHLAAASSVTKCITAGGYVSGGAYNYLEATNYSTGGQSRDIGNCSISRYGMGGCGSITRAMFGGGYWSVGREDIVYTEFATAAGTSSFGSLISGGSFAAAASSSTRALFMGGSDGADKEEIDWFTIATTGSGTYFGNLTAAVRGHTACSSSTRVVHSGGVSVKATQGYVTTATEGNATTWSSLSPGRHDAGGCSSRTRGFVLGGSNSEHVITYFEFAGAGTSLDFGDLWHANYGNVGASNCHGGL